MKELGTGNASNQQANLTWQCWLVNTNTTEEILIAYDYPSLEECKREARDILSKWDNQLYPSHQGWTLIYRQDTPLKMAQYWRDYYEGQNDFWNQRCEQIIPDNQTVSFPKQQPSHANIQRKRKRIRRKRVKVKASNTLRPQRGIDIGIHIGRLLASTLLVMIALEIINWLNKPKNPGLLVQPTGDIPLSIRELFGSKKAPGSIAVGVAEGNLTPSGKPTAIYKGHTDPGNFATNRGFCSWNKSQGLTVAQADQNCIQTLQTKSIATENQLFSLGLNPENHKIAIVMGSDLWNQSNSAGPMFPFTYKAAMDKGLSGQQAYVWARVEAFRNEQRELDASGLFGICRREPFYRQKLTGLVEGSEEWRWNCIKLDQLRRIREVEKVLQLHLLEL
jgi:D-alanyl-D-alanine dipeptidase